MDGQCPRKLSVDEFKWADDLSKYTEDFMKNYDKNSDYGSILEVDVEYPKELWVLHKDLPILAEKKKIRKSRKTCY